MSFEYGSYQKEVARLFSLCEKGELTFSEFKEQISKLVKEVEGEYELLVEQSAGEDWQNKTAFVEGENLSTLAKEQIRWTKKQTLLNAVMPLWWNRQTQET